MVRAECWTLHDEKSKWTGHKEEEPEVQAQPWLIFTITLWPYDGHDGKWQKHILENMVHLYVTSSWIWLNEQSPFWPTGLNMGPQSWNTRRGLQTNYGRPRLYYCKIWTQTHKHNICNAGTYVSRTHANAFKHSHSWTHSENTRLRALGEGGRVHTRIYRTLHVLSLYLCQLRAGGQISQRHQCWLDRGQAIPITLYGGPLLLLFSSRSRYDYH